MRQPLLCGTFDGRSHKIINLKLDTESEYQGLFGYNKGTIKNLEIEGEDINLNSTEKYTGIIAGYSEGLIESCCNKVNIICKRGKENSYLGGIVGEIAGEASINKCYNSGQIDIQNGENLCQVGRSFWFCK